MEMIRRGIGRAIGSILRSKRKCDNPDSPMFKARIPGPTPLRAGDYWTDGYGCTRRNLPKRDKSMSPRQWKRLLTAQRRDAKAAA